MQIFSFLQSYYTIIWSKNRLRSDQVLVNLPNEVIRKIFTHYLQREIRNTTTLKQALKLRFVSSDANQLFLSNGMLRFNALEFYQRPRRSAIPLFFSAKQDPQEQKIFQDHCDAMNIRLPTEKRKLHSLMWRILAFVGHLLLRQFRS